MMKLEKEKRELEIKELKRRWFQRADYLKLVLTAIILVVTVYLTNKTGILDSRKENLRLESNILILDIKEFKLEKSGLKNEISLKKDSLMNMRRVNKKIQKRLIESTSNEEKLKIAKLRAENKTEEIIIFYKSKVDSLKMTIIKSKELQNAWTDQDGNKLTDQDGNYLMLNGEYATINGQRIKVP